MATWCNEETRILYRRASARGDLVRAAKDLIRQRGVAATSPRQIQFEAGAGQGSFYHHFRGKADLMAEALAELAGELTDQAETTLIGRLPSHALHGFLRMPRDAEQGSPLGRLASEASLEDPLLRRPVARHFRVVQARLEATVRDGQRRGSLPRRGKPHQVAALLIAAMEGGIVLSRIHREPARLGHVKEALRDLLVLRAGRAG